MTSVGRAASHNLSVLPQDYAERVYAGVLGKIIGVYLGRPVEDWRYDRIQRELGDIWYYVSQRLGRELVTTDDDITGTFTFVRAVEDAGDEPGVSAEQIGRTWLNYLIEGRTILWWSGMGNSTEHTAYLRLKAGIPAPTSGSLALNGQVVAEQIGGQIFIDGWAMLHPGDPEQAADLARRAASVSHDGAAVHAAQVIAAMEAQAFVESDLNRVIDAGVATIPADSIIRRLIDDVRQKHAVESEWRQARVWLDENYGYGKYGGNVHVVPNHGLIILSLLYGEDDFQRSMMIVNTSGWDTDCNAGNLGCLMGIKNGLPGLDSGPDWRGPVADRLFLPTADGGRAITDAVREADALTSLARRMRGLAEARPKDGARFHFSYPGSVQGFAPDPEQDVTSVTVTNVPDRAGGGVRGLLIGWSNLTTGRVARVLTPTFITDPTTAMDTYELIASPTLYPGQTVKARVRADVSTGEATVVSLVLRHYVAQDEQLLVRGPRHRLEPGIEEAIKWVIPDTGSQPISAIGLEVTEGPLHGSLHLDRLDWSGAPTVRFVEPESGGTMWRRAWVDAVDHWPTYFETFRIMHDSGVGLLSQGTAEWRDYEASSRIRLHMGRSGGLAVRVQGRGRWYGLLLKPDGTVDLVRAQHSRTVLASADLGLDPALAHDLRLAVTGQRLMAWVDGAAVFDVTDPGTRLRGGGVALVVEEGRLEAEVVEVRPFQG